MSSLLGDLCFLYAGLVLVSILRLGQGRTATRDEQESLAGVGHYRLTYLNDDYKVLDTDLLAAFRVVPQPGVLKVSSGSAIADESSTGTWTTVWIDTRVVDTFGSWEVGS